MSKISGKETQPEILVRKYLFSFGYRLRKNVVSLPGKPDIVLPRYKTIILVNGCFWYGHKRCNAWNMPKSNVQYWKNKINYNIDRDIRNIRKLKKLGWRVLIVWECKLRNVKEKEKTFFELIERLDVKYLNKIE